MAAGDMGWSDCGRETESQFFYGRKIGRKQAGRCGRYEVRTALYARRLTNRWKRLFKMKFEREPSGEELWAVLRTGEIAENVRDWERIAFKESKSPRKPHVNRGRHGKRMTKILAEYVRDSKNCAEIAIKQELIKQEMIRIKFEENLRLLKIRQSSEVPRNILVRLAYNKIESRVVHLLYGVDARRVSVLIGAFGLKRISDEQKEESEERQG